MYITAVFGSKCNQDSFVCSTPDTLSFNTNASMDFDQTRTELNRKLFFSQENYLVGNNNNVNKRKNTYFYQPRSTRLTSFDLSLDTAILVCILYNTNAM